MMTEEIFDNVVQYFNLEQYNAINPVWMPFFETDIKKYTIRCWEYNGTHSISVKRMDVWVGIPTKELAEEIMQYMKIIPLLYI